jgi:preprotein translocase subunit SecY
MRRSRALIDMFSGAAAGSQIIICRHGCAAVGSAGLSVIGGVIAITQAQRKIPVQYAQRAVGRKMYAGGTSFMPLR